MAGVHTSAKERQVTYWYPLSENTIGEEEISSVTDVLRSGKTTMGEKVEEFEEAFARYVKAPYAVMVNSGSSADLLAAYAIDVEGNAVLPAVTWPTHVWSWVQSGNKVVFCDVDGVNTTTKLIEETASDKTKIISIPHLMGIPVDIEGLMQLVDDHRWYLHEDCCEALGATYRHDKPVGWFADIASWSFFFSHQMTTMEGGMVTTPHSLVARKLRSLRSHGWTRHFSKDKYTFHDQGFNLRPTEVAAAIGLVQLGKLDAMNAQRSQNFHEFERKLRKHPHVSLPTVPEGVKPSWFGVPMFVDQNRDGLAKHLESCGVETRPILAGNLKNQPGFKGFYFGKTPGADRVTEEGLFVGLPAGPKNGASEVGTLIAGWDGWA